MKLLRSWIAAILLVTTLGGSLMAVTLPTSVSAAGNGCSSFLGFPAWYDGLTKGDNCEIKSPKDFDTAKTSGLQIFIMRIAMNVVGMALVGVAYISIGFILYAGLILIKGLTGVAPGSPEVAAKARKMILNACIGLIISLTAITIVGFIIDIYTIGDTGLSGFGLPSIAADQALQTGLNMFYFVIGVASVIVMIIAGFMFTAGGSEPSSIAQAKNMIYYSVAGLVVSILAFTITGFIIDRLG
jgi:Type IV secretion system pilin